MASSFLKSARLFSGVSLAAILAVPAMAQSQVAADTAIDNDTIVVTATKRASDLQDVPFSINAQTQADIQRWAPRRSRICRAMSPG